MNIANQLFPLLVSVSANTENKAHEGYVVGILFCYFVVSGVFYEIFGNRLLTAIREKRSKERIVEPHILGIGRFVLDELVWISVWVVSIYVHSFVFFVSFLLVSVLYGVYAVKICTFRMKYSKKRIHYTMWFRRKTVHRGDVRCVFWDSQGRGFGSKLVLCLGDGSVIELSEAYYSGLIDFYYTFA